MFVGEPVCFAAMVYGAQVDNPYYQSETMKRRLNSVRNGPQGGPVPATSRSLSPRWRSIRFRLALRTHDAPPRGCIVRVVSQTKSRKIPTRKIITALFRAQAKHDLSHKTEKWYAPRAVQFHPHGGQSEFVWLSARTPHGGASYVR